MSVSCQVALDALLRLTEAGIPFAEPPFVTFLVEMDSFTRCQHLSAC